MFGISDTSAKTDHITPDEIVTIIKDYIESNYCTNIRISMFAEKYFFSQEYLNKLFKNKYGFTIYEYVLKLRMERAAELLAQPDINISDIAERLGYADGIPEGVRLSIMYQSFSLPDFYRTLFYPLYDYDFFYDKKYKTYCPL